jgi:hypothetical protein
MSLFAFNVVTGVGEYVSSQLVSTAGGTPNRIVRITPGQIAWDECDCGLFAQSITSIASSQSFPTPASDVPIVSGCGHQLIVVSVTMVLIRCIPGLDDNGNSPSVTALFNAARVMEDDRSTLRRSLAQRLKNLLDTYVIHGYTIGTATSIGPEGQCGGIELTYSFGISNDAAGC